MSAELVLVTGGSGFVATHCIAQLVAAGYQVRTTVRSPAREVDVLALLKNRSACRRSRACCASGSVIRPRRPRRASFRTCS